MTFTLLTLPAEIRNLIWDYFVASPTHRILPAHFRYHPPWASHLVPIIWSPDSYIQDLIIASQVMYFVPGSPATATPLTPCRLPLANPLPLVNRQFYAEISARFWSANTLVFHNYAIVKGALARLGKARLRVERMEMDIGHAWQSGSRQVARMKDMLSELEQLVHEGSLRKLRLRYGDVSVCYADSFDTWKEVLSSSGELGDWGECEREVVWGKYRMKTGRLREVLARCWRLEGGLYGWDDTVTDEDWVLV